MLFGSIAYASSGFLDVPENHYAYEAIKSVKTHGIINGYPGNTFKPNDLISRAEMAVLMCRMSGEDVSLSANPFSDVPDTHWARGYITKANEKGIILGNGKGLFRPDDFVTYEEAVKMAVMATGKASAVGIYPEGWSQSFIKIASLSKITDNLQTLSGENITRADVAVMIDNSLKLKNNPDCILLAKHIYNDRQNIPVNTAFCLDLSILKKDNNVYDKNLAKASAVLSMTAYKYINFDGKSGNGTNRLLQQMGFNTIKTIDTSKNFSDNHVTTMHIGKRALASTEKETHVISVVFKGTDESSEEWASNFDVGNGEDNIVYNKENHKGYDITAKRAVEEIEKYISENTNDTSEKILWITGHSRGASLANLCGAYLADKGNTCFVYGFAPSMSTTRTDAHKYDFIFNIINSDDLITYMPLATWGFRNFGKSASVSLGKEHLTNWQNTTGLKNYKFKDNISLLVSELSEFAPSRKACYEYSDNGIIKIDVNSAFEGEIYVKNFTSLIPKNAVPYFTYEIKKVPAGGMIQYFVQLNMQPAFYLHTIASVMTENKNIPLLLMIPVPEKMADAYSLAMSTYSGGIVHPHTPETYYVLTDNITKDDFK